MEPSNSHDGYLAQICPSLPTGRTYITSGMAFLSSSTAYLDEIIANLAASLSASAQSRIQIYKLGLKEMLRASYSYASCASCFHTPRTISLALPGLLHPTVLPRPIVCMKLGRRAKGFSLERRPPGNRKLEIVFEASLTLTQLVPGMMCFCKFTR